ncbi:glycoside hydrolase family 15 protein [Solirubrobacter ginsenosidimutans]|uniref:Glycoside hydrolase family 15 protein n=1 Tax=Solirubrobacter ginsenosidimutans TaxID=490573 RepID=A0A9X3MTC9_9ACTN|nr:glucodextranase DOMON-like domain-containing protein [Solirubrobacter ginsenosidimutans]MDA0162160.1 glycoside hydrolase family 15 protein [Solirubrobacter ginsenosidimutans]
MNGRVLNVAVVTAAFAFGPATAFAAPATDGPGAMSHFDLARKDCVGTAQNERSKVWFTVADGVLSDVYYPTNDTTNNETLQYVVTDGKTFTDLQTRDMTYTVQALDKRALSCRVVAKAKSGKYRITTDFLTDPQRPTVILRSRFEALKGKTRDYQVYARFDPTLNGNGGGTPGNGGADTGATAGNVLVGSDTVTATNAANRDYAQPVFSALDGGFTQVSNGYAGAASDGLKQLDAAHKLTALYSDAAPGNLVQTGKVDIGHDGSFTLALAFGSTQAQALSTAKRTLRTPLWLTAALYLVGWHRYDDGLNEPKRPRNVSRDTWDDLLDTYYLSANYVKAATDKTFPGATSAAMASPWGQAIAAGDPANTYFGSYREVFGRDLYEAWTAAYLSGDRKLATDMTRFLFERQQLPDGSMPRNSLTNGKQAPDSFNTQLDECAYPLIMALAVGLTGRDYYTAHIRPAANFVATHGPAFGPERWEEQDGYSPSTISAEIAGLIAAAKIADMNGDRDSAAVWRGVADQFQRNLKTWTLTTNGTAGPTPYFIRLSKTGDPNAAITYNVGNGGPDLDQRNVIDAGFLEYARLGLLKSNDPDIVRSLGIVDNTIKKTTATGDGFLRYNGDGYGDGSSDGHPWAPSNKGTGHVWPVLAGERGQWELTQGNTAAAVKRAQAMAAMGSGVGLIPEQTWDAAPIPRSPFGTDPTTASIGFVNGGPAGSAAALTWSAAQFVRLMLIIGSGDALDTPDYTVDRYVKHTQGTTTLTVTAPADRSIAATSTTVTGTSSPGNTITVSAVNQDDHTSVTRSATVPNSGAFSIPVPLTGGTTVLNVVATSKSGGTARAVRTVVWDVAPGTLVYGRDDPDNDDHGPGNFAYPTSSNFKPGAYDLQRFEVYDAGDRIIFRVRTRDLTPTFGSPLGAQLVDVYVHIPGASPTSTASAFGTRNYTLAPWAKRIEVQGFGQQYVDAGGATLGQVTITGNDVSRYITFSVTKASLGTPTSGWGFTLVLHGQDGFSSDQARGFQPTPQDFQFGVCAAANPADAHCTANPNTVPKAMDTLTAPTELDYTLHPVVLTPVTIP